MIFCEANCLPAPLVTNRMKKMCDGYELKIKLLPYVLTLMHMDCRKWFIDAPKVEIFGPNFMEEWQPPLTLTLVKDKLEKLEYTCEKDVLIDVSLIFQRVMLHFPSPSLQYCYASDLLYFFQRHANTSELDVKTKGRMIVPPPDYAKLSVLQGQVQELQHQLELLKSTTATPPVAPAAAEAAAAPKLPPRQLTLQEKCKLGMDIGLLPTDKIPALLDIIQRSRPSLVPDDAGAKTVEIDISSIPTVTLREMQIYVRDSLQTVKKKSRDDMILSYVQQRKKVKS
jgi:hypothetical protein